MNGELSTSFFDVFVGVTPVTMSAAAEVGFNPVARDEGFTSSKDASETIVDILGAPGPLPEFFWFVP